MWLPETLGLTAKKPVVSLVSDLETMPMQIRQQHLGPPMPPTGDPVTLAAQTQPKPLDAEEVLTNQIVLADWESLPETQPKFIQGSPPQKKQRTDD